METYFTSWALSTMTFELNSQQKRSVKARQDLGIDRGLTWISHVSVDLLHVLLTNSDAHL